jgi:acyl-CoA thioesterase
MRYSFDKATELKYLSEGVHTFGPNKEYWNFNSAFGGWMAAIMAKALKLHSGYRGEIVAQHIQFISAVKAEKLYVIVTRREKKRQADFWSVMISDASENGRPLAIAEIATNVRKDSELSYCADMPKTKKVEDCFRIRTNPETPRWFDKYEIMLSEGRPFAVNPSPRNVVLIREDDHRPVDVLAVTAIVDTSMPRPFFLGKTIRSGSTLSMSTHIYASEQEIAEVGTGYMVLEVNSATIQHAMANQESRLFRKDGLLLATSYQTAVFSL